MNPIDRVHSSWKPLLPFLNQEPLLSLNRDILPNISYYPKQQDIFRVFEMPLQNIKVVVLGQDPYFSPNQANGLAFSVNNDTTLPPSLKNIQQEVISSTGELYNPNSDTMWKTLETWKEQGVFLLNTALTVEAGLPGSHLKYWDRFIRTTINYIAVNNPCLWFLWGKSAQSFTVNMPIKNIQEVVGYDGELIERIPISPYNNYIFKAAHPAAEAYRPNAGFFGCDHFYLSNRVLDKLGKTKINW